MTLSNKEIFVATHKKAYPGSENSLKYLEQFLEDLNLID